MPTLTVVNDMVEEDVDPTQDIVHASGSGTSLVAASVASHIEVAENIEDRHCPTRQGILEILTHRRAESIPTEETGPLVVELLCQYFIFNIVSLLT